MIAVALLLAAAAATSAVDAERAFAAMAQTQGQWTAFRAFAAPEALIFGPEPGNAQAALKDLANPPVSVMWWPGRSWVSCDGGLAINTGPWVRSGGKSTGTFTTVWQRQPGGDWKWLLDHGRDTPRAVVAGEQPRIDRPVCKNLKAASPSELSNEASDDLLVQVQDTMPSSSLPALAPEDAGPIAAGTAVDGSLRWEARALKGEKGAHSFRVWTWDGARYRLRLYEVTGIARQ
jgi:hypothetical protein